jgi:diadenosine tetraphosphate (Ap4A) HIT family hydrolase
MIEQFALHERLRADTAEVAAWDLSLLLLMNEARWPWLILVPRRPAVREIEDLSASDRGRLIEEAAAASRLLQALHAPHKVNIAALGNMVPQFHLHVVARTEGDPAWPKPVWGQFPPAPYEAAALEARLSALRQALAEGRHRG